MPQEERVLSVFVDESGTFHYPDLSSRFYIIGLVFHDQDVDIGRYIHDLDENTSYLGIDSDVFACHTGPLIRKEKIFGILLRDMRAKIFNLMFDFVRRVNFSYHCLCVDQKYVTSSYQIFASLQDQLTQFLETQRSALQKYDRIKVYYDCGQSPVTNLLHKTFSADLGCIVEFAQNVKPQRYKMFQVADMVCTLHLIEQKLLHNIPMTESEFRFFGGPRKFKRNILKALRRKEIL